MTSKCPSASKAAHESDLSDESSCTNAGGSGSGRDLKFFCLIAAPVRLWPTHGRREGVRRLQEKEAHSAPSCHHLIHPTNGARDRPKRPSFPGATTGCRYACCDGTSI